MKTSEISDEQIRKYLLGEAEPELEERLDELSFADGYAEMIGSVENDLLDEYVSDALAPTARAAFESHYLVSSRGRAKVQFARALGGLPDRVRAPVKAAERIVKPGFFHALGNLRLVFRAGLAAGGLLLFAFLGWMFVRSSREDAGSTVAVLNNARSTPAASPTALTSEMPVTIATPTPAASPVTRASPTPAKTPTATAPTIAIAVLRPALRSGAPQIVKAANGAALRLRLLLETEEPGPYSVELLDEISSARIWSVENLRAGDGAADRSVTITVPAGKAAGGIYRVVLEARTAGGREKVGDYIFEVVR